MYEFIITVYVYEPNDLAIAKIHIIFYGQTHDEEKKMLS